MSAPPRGGTDVRGADAAAGRELDRLRELRFDEVHFFIGERAYVQRGLGPQVVRAFLKAVVFERLQVESCVAGPHPLNRVAIAAFRKAGFGQLKKVVDIETGQAECIMRIERGVLT